MQPERVLRQGREASAIAGDVWTLTLLRLTICWLALFILTLSDWREMAHQWWDIDTYAHIVLIPPVLAWLVWLRRDVLARIKPDAWWPGLSWCAMGLGLWLVGRENDINLVAQAGAVAALQGATIALVGLRATLVLAFPLAYAFFLVPFGDEIIAPLQVITAKMAVGLTHLSGVPAVIDGYYIDTPAGRFVVAEECSGVKFLIAMVALGTLGAWTAFVSWKRRLAFVALAAIASITANGVRAWGTIFVAQYIGIERAGGFDHLVYGWIFFALVIACVLAIGWRYFERDPTEAGLSTEDVSKLDLGRLVPMSVAPDAIVAVIVAATIGFAALARLV